MAATCKQRVYVRGSYVPFEEDETHEFKGHREIAPEDTPPWAFRHPTESQSRKAISRNLNAFLNTGLGGVVYCGVDDRGRVLGLHLTRYQKDHMLLSVRCLLMRYRPAVPSARYRVTFVPVVSSAEVDDPPTEFAYDVSRRTKQHLVATSHYCWCDADARARSVSGIIPLSYVIEIEILPWADRDKALHPFYLTESGQCYVRRQASIMPLTAADCIRITRHQAAALIRRQSEQMALQSQRDISALQARLDSGLLVPASCRCTSGSDTPDPPRPPTGESAGTVGREDGRAEGGEELVVDGAAASGVDMVPASAQISAGANGLMEGCSGDREASERRGSSTDSEPPQAQSEDMLAPSVSTELPKSPRKLTHSSSSDSGVSLSPSSDTSLARKSCSAFIKKSSSSSDVESSCDVKPISTASTDVDSNQTPPSELAESTEFASGVEAVSDLLREVLAARIPPPPSQQCLTDGAGAGESVESDSYPRTYEQNSQTLSEANCGTGESESHLVVSSMAPGENGSDISLVAPAAGPDRALVDLETSGTDLETSETRLETSGMSVDGEQLEEMKTALNACGDMGNSEAFLGNNDTKLEPSVTELDDESDLKQAAMSFSESSQVEKDPNLVASDVDLNASDVDSSAKDSRHDMSVVDLNASESDVPICAASDTDASRSELTLSESDTSLLAPVSRLTPRVGDSYTSADTTASSSSPVVFTLAGESDSAPTTEVESGYSFPREESLLSVSDSTLGVRSEQETRSALPLGGVDASSARVLSRDGTPSTKKLPRGIRGRGKVFENPGKAQVATGGILGLTLEVMPVQSKVRANIGKFIDVSEAFGSAGLNGRQYELDSDDSEDSWDAEYQPEHRLVASLSDGATVV